MAAMTVVHSGAAAVSASARGPTRTSGMAALPRQAARKRAAAASSGTTTTAAPQAAAWAASLSMRL